jgi:release factor glutamine methyltransferase
VSAKTYAELLRSGSDMLRAAGLEAPVQEARHLLIRAASLSSVELISRDTEIAPQAHQAAFEALITARASRIPQAHITGHKSFFGLTIRTDDRALIPRDDSETVVDLALSLIPEAASWRLADLGTGSGALLAALLHSRSATHGVAVEASAAALSLAIENFDDLGLAARIETVSRSWSYWDGWAECDLIISNPPYIRRDVIPTLAPEVREYDPLEALDGGMDGLDAYREIITLAGQKMKPAAHLVLEIGYDQKDAVSTLLEGAGFAMLQHGQDLSGNDRAIAAIKT